jgi:hypothetical protein
VTEAVRRIGDPHSGGEPQAVPPVQGAGPPPKINFSATLGGSDAADVDRGVADALQVGAVIVATRDVDAATSGTAPPIT